LQLSEPGPEARPIRKETLTLVTQTEQKLQGKNSIAERIVSFHDPVQFAQKTSPSAGSLGW